MTASLRRHLVAFRTLLVLTVLTGIAYPLLVLGLAQIPGLKARADGSMLGGHGSSLIGQSFTDAQGNALPQYFQSRPSDAGAGYDPTATSASNLGPESILDTDGHPSLLTQVCARSLAVGTLEGVDGGRPFCATVDGVAFGAVLSVTRTGGTVGAVTSVTSVNQAAGSTPFLASYDGVPVTVGAQGDGVLVPVKGTAAAVVPSDAVTASASGLDPAISPAYAALQVARVARTRGLSVAEVQKLVAEHTRRRFLGFVGEPGVQVLPLNLALDAAQ